MHAEDATFPAVVRRRRPAPQLDRIRAAPATTWPGPVRAQREASHRSPPPLRADGAAHFAIEITWYGETIRVAVADGGGPTGPHLIDDPTADHGRALVMVRALSTRLGVCGDQRGRLVWAEVSWAGTSAASQRPPGDAYEIAVHQYKAALARRFTGADIWFGRVHPAVVGAARSSVGRPAADRVVRAANWPS